MAYLLRYADGSVQPLSGRVAITRQDNDLTKPDTVQAAFSTSFALPDDVATHRRLALAQLGTSLSTAPYAGLGCALEAGGVEVLPGARLALDDYTPRTGYTGKLLAGNKQFYDLLGDKKLRELDLLAFDHDWTLAQVAAAAGNSRWQQGYVYDLYDRGLGAPPLPAAGSSRLFEAGYWPTAYARAVWEAIFLGAGVKWSGDLPAVFDTALLPATASFGYSDATRAAHRVVAGYATTAQALRFDDVGDEAVPLTAVLPTKKDSSLVLGAEAQWNPVTHEATITQRGYYTLQADQAVHMFSPNFPGAGTITAKLSVYVNGKLVGNSDAAEGKGQRDVFLTGLAERVLLQPGDRVTAHWQRDNQGSFLGLDYGWVLETDGRLSVELLADFHAGGRVHLSDWLPDMTQRDYVKGFIQLYGVTQTTDPYTGSVHFARAGAAIDNARQDAADWTERVDGSQPIKRNWRCGDFAQRNFFRWKEDSSHAEYTKAQAQRLTPGLYWDEAAAKVVAQDYAAGHLAIGITCTGLEQTKDVIVLPFAASQQGTENLLLIPCWKPKPGTDYAADLEVIADAVRNADYTEEVAQLERLKALTNDFDTQDVAPRLVYQSTKTRAVLLEDDKGNTQQVDMRLSYFVDRSQAEDLDFTRSLLPLYYPHLAAALVRPLTLRPYVSFTAAEVVNFTQSKLVWLETESAFFWVNKLTWEDEVASHEVELIRLSI